jgi:PAS domain S-box-containing protein
MVLTPTPTNHSQRTHAEEMLRADHAEISETHMSIDKKRLYHELQVHQIELEMQNVELQRALAEMREHKERLSSIITYTPAGYFCIDTVGRFTEVNKSWLNMFGYSSTDEVIGKHFSMIQVESELWKQQAHLAKLLKGESIPSGEFASRRKDGSIGYHTFSAHPVVHADKIIRLEWFLIDISDRKKHETIAEISREALQILNEPENIKDTLHRVIALLKSRMEFDAVGIRLQEDDDFPYLAQDGFPKDFLIKENTLVERTVEDDVCRDKDGCAKLECTCGLVISGKADTCLPFFTLGGSFWTNDSLPLLDIPHDVDPRHNPRNECIHLGYPSVALVPIRVKDRIVGLIQFNDKQKGKFDLDTVELLEAIASNIGSTLMRKQLENEKVLLEHQFHQAQKLESLGVLAGGIAHDFNNILTIILGHCYIIDGDIGSEPDYKGHVKRIELAANRAADLCRQMLNYAGKSSLTRGRVNLWLQVDENVKMLTSSVKKNVAIELDLKYAVPEITGDSAQIQQVIMNLIINAAEAIGDKNGTIKISLKKETILEEQADRDFIGKLIPPGNYACLTVSDNGCGMDRETQNKIFEPFYTTKFTGRGLGMSAVLGILKSHNGVLLLSSTLGVGTTFKVYFPSVDNSAAFESAPAICPDLSIKASGTILLVDDEESLRIIGSALLNAMGFTPMTAADGREALELYREHGSKIDLIMLDMLMPVMSGTDAYRLLRETSSVIPIVICSGCSVEEIECDIKEDEHAAVLQKPYNPRQMQDVFMKLIDFSE